MLKLKMKTLRANKAIKIQENLLVVRRRYCKEPSTLVEGDKAPTSTHCAFLDARNKKASEFFQNRRSHFSQLATSSSTQINQDSKKNSTGIYDANRPFIASMISELGAVPVDLGIAKDNFGVIKAKMLKGLRYDALILSAGSSVGERDYVARAADSIQGVRILVHGVAMRPSSPTGIASYKGKPILLLPGFPTSAIISFFVFANPAILRLSGCTNVEQPHDQGKAC